MTNNRLLTLMLACSLGVSCTMASDTVGIREMVNRIDVFNKLLPQEKVYLHFDNTAYYMGEKMWFKAYVIRSDNNHPTSVSKVLYVELLDRTGNVIDTQKLPIDKLGQADGTFNLNKVLAGGFYEVRAYTRYMLNWDSSWLFSRVFPIFEAPEKEGDYSVSSLGGTDWQPRETEMEKVKSKIAFLPEGGHLVENLPCRVAFEVRDKKGLPVSGVGELLDGDVKVCDVRTSDEGRGVFAFTPQTGKKYTLKLKSGKGKSYEKDLPMAESVGCGIHVQQKNHSWHLDLTTSANLPSDSLGIVLTAHGALRHLDVVASSRQVSLALPDSVVADGVNRVSIIDKQGQILADRLFFQYPRVTIDSIGVQVKEKALLPSQNINLSFHTCPSTVFSLSIRDADKEKNVSSLDCANWLLLAGELRGYVAHPDYYLESDDETHRQAADLLMMVQGWRRYDLSQMIGKKKFEILYPVEKGLSIIGKLVAPNKKQSVAKQNLRFRLFNEFGQTLSGNATTDSQGYYTMMVPDCEGDWNMFINMTNKYRVTIDRSFSPLARPLSSLEQMPPMEVTRAMTTFHYTDSVEKAFDQSTKGSMLTRTHMLPTVVKKQHFWETGIAWDSESVGKKSSYIYYDIDKETDKIMDRGETTPYIYEWLKKKNSDFAGGYNELFEFGLNERWCYSRNSPDGDFSYKNYPILWVLDNQPRCITNSPTGMEEKEFTKKLSIREMPALMEEVKSIYVSDDLNDWKRYLNSFVEKERSFADDTSMKWVQSLGDMVTVYVYTHKMFTKCPKDMRRTHFEGYSPLVQFYSPEYGDLPANEDFRRTLYWNPYVVSDKDGNVNLTICNTGTCKQLIVSAEAITPQGKAIKNK